MDFVMDLPNSKGKSVIMMVVDRITKYAHFCAPYHHFKANMDVINKVDIRFTYYIIAGKTMRHVTKNEFTLDKISVMEHYC